MIFLNYRRADSEDLIRSLEDRLIAAFGQGTHESPLVFRDKRNLIGSQTLNGDIEKWVCASEVLLVVIGPDWTQAKFTEGDNKDLLRLSMADDYVRQEITWALQQGIHVIPVLLGKAEMPRKGFLKGVGLEGLADRPFVDAGGDVFESAIETLIQTIAQNPRFARLKTAYETRKQAGQNPIQPSDDLTPVRPILPSDYIRRLQKSIADIDLFGLAAKQTHAVKLNSVYVPLTTPNAKPDVKQDANASEETENQPAEFGGREAELPQVLLSLLNNHSLYVSGPAGCGKSTFCRWVTWLACAGSLPEAPVAAPEEFAEIYPDSFRGRLPVLVALREFWTFLPRRAGCVQFHQNEIERALGEWIDSTRPHGLERGVFEGHLRQGTLLLIVDGVDEVPIHDGKEPFPAPLRGPLVAGLGTACAEWIAQGHRVLITSRPYGLEPHEIARLGVPHHPVSELPRPLQDLLVHRWFRCLEADPADARRQADEMLRHVRERKDLRDLIQNPMLLTATSVVYHEGKRLPQDRHDLYERISKNVLYNRFAKQPERIPAIGYQLKYLAYGMHTGIGLGDLREKPEAQIDDAQIDKLLTDCRKEGAYNDLKAAEIAKVREDLLTNSGLFLPQAQKRAGFYHLTFQDFFAASRLIEEHEADLAALFLARGPSPAWRSTLNFISGALVQQEKKFGLFLMEFSTRLEPTQWQTALVLWDTLQIVDRRKMACPPEVKAKLVAICLKAIAEEAPLVQRHELGLALGHLGDPRLATDLRQSADWIEIPAGKYLLGENPPRTFVLESPVQIAKYLVTNAQYAVFCDEQGYQDALQQTPCWWSPAGAQWVRKNQITQPSILNDSEWNGPNQPVVGVSWYEAEAFANWAGCRLPTADESEAAARGPSGGLYPWGNHWRDGICNSLECNLFQTSAVGLFVAARSTDFGLEDSTGNAWEWCAGGQGEARVVRGGSWVNNNRLVRCAFRFHNLVDRQSSHLGFRLVRGQKPL